DHAKVDAIAESIEALGLQNPISVCRDGDGYLLVAGKHRLEAVKTLGHRVIAATVITHGNRLLWEIDENLARAELTPEEKREHLKRRKELWERRQAEPTEAENSGAPCATNRGRGRPKGFATETAGAIGKSKSQINRMLAAPKAKGKPMPTRHH